MGGKHNHDAVPLRLVVLLELRRNVLCKSFHQLGVRGPSLDARPLDFILRINLRRKPRHFVETGLGRRDGVLRILGKGNSSGDAVIHNLLVCVLGQGVCVSKRHIRFMGCSLGRNLVEDLASLTILVLAPFANRRAAANLLVVRCNGWSATSGDELGQDVLERPQRNDVFITLSTKC